MKTQASSLRMTNITKRYSGVPAILNVDLDVRPGEVHALLGENGAGKSTLMNVASGTVTPDSGDIFIEGEHISSLTPALASKKGIAFVHQHPAVLNDLTVLENLLVALPSSIFAPKKDTEKIAQNLLSSFGLEVSLKQRVDSLSVSQKHLLEIAKAFALQPKILILDEPTAPLGKESVDLLFTKVRELLVQGTSVIYITHRLAEVRELADRVTVLRDGTLRGVENVANVTDQELLTLIIGRKLDSTFPPKASSNQEPNLTLANLSGFGFAEVNVSMRPGEILGIAGVVGNGQSELMKALAGLIEFTGDVEISGRSFSTHELLSESAYLPADRHHEGLMMSLSVRENAAISALRKFTKLRIISSKKENKQVGLTLQELSVKTRSAESVVSSLSGGNQQKVVMARALLSEPKLIVADEPTQGVDVGARSEIYRLLREISLSGIPVVVNSSDAKELEGLCDRVLVLSRGHVIQNLVGKDITEAKIVTAAVSSTTESVNISRVKSEDQSSRWRRFISGDYAPTALLLSVMLLLGGFILSQNDRYLNDFNINSILMLVTALGFIALGQTIALLIGGIDLSVGPLAGLLVVVASFFINDGSPIESILLGLLTMIAVSILVGLINGSLIRFGKFTAIAATLTMYIALQGVSFILRDGPDGYINQDITSAIKLKFGPIPLVFIILVALTLAMEYALRKTRWGWGLRATGSDEESARRVGVNINKTVILAYVATSLLTFLGAIILLAQLGVGDPAQGVSYTLTSITAVVLGGTSLLGGRGTFIGTLFGALLLIQVMNATVFLGLDQTWQYMFQGILILAAAIFYSVARTRKKGISS